MIDILNSDYVITEYEKEYVPNCIDRFCAKIEFSDYESINFLESDKNKLFNEVDTKNLIKEKQQHISENSITKISLSKNHLMQNNALGLIEIAKIEALGLENIK